MSLYFNRNRSGDSNRTLPANSLSTMNGNNLGGLDGYFACDASSTMDGDQPSTMTRLSELTGMTPRINNLSCQNKPVDLDDDLTNVSDEVSEEKIKSNIVADHQNSDTRKGISRSRITMMLCFLIFLITCASIILTVMFNKREDQREANAILNDDTLFEEDRSSSPTSELTTTPTQITQDFSGEILQESVVRGESPSGVPSNMFSDDPSSRPSVLSSLRPSTAPTKSPTISSSTLLPTKQPTNQPTNLPTNQPTNSPTNQPTKQPTKQPSKLPTSNPTSSPTNLASSPPSLRATKELVTSSNLSIELEETLKGEQLNEEFGYSIETNGDGTIIAVGIRNYLSDGKPEAGLVKVYEQRKRNNEWVLKGQPIAGRKTMDKVGSAIALSKDGHVLAVSEARGGDDDLYNGITGRSGNIRVFSWNKKEQDWEQLGSEISGDRAYSSFGMSMALSADGSRLIVGAPYETLYYWQTGRVRVFQLNEQTNSWDLLGQPLDGINYMDWFGWSVDISDDGQRIAIGSPRDSQNSGYVKVYDLIVFLDTMEFRWSKVGDDITNTHIPVHPEDRFGLSLSLSSDRIAISSPWKESSSSEAYNIGLVAVYELDGKQGWKLIGSPISGEASSSQLGMAVSLKDDYLLIGSPGGKGQISLHHYDGQDWTSDPLVISGTGIREDNFGIAVTANDDFTKIFVGAPASSSVGLTGSVSIYSRQS